MEYNIIIITTDQQRYDSLGCYGSSFVSTPNIDKMASNGIVFNRAYCTNPVCTPSRASIHGGKYISRHGAWNVGMNVPQDEQFISHIMKNNGYKTHLIGKAHFNAFEGEYEQSIETLSHWRERFPQFKGPYYGFDTVELALGHTTYGVAGHYGYWVYEKLKTIGVDLPVAKCKADKPFGGEAYDWDIPLELSNSMWTAHSTVEFLKEMATSHTPFVLSIGFQDPHHPHVLPVEYASTLNPGKIPLPNYVEGELEDKPEHFRTARIGQLEGSKYRGRYPVAGQHFGFDYRHVTDDDARCGRAYYYGMVQLIDRAMGMIMDTLEQTGLDRNTIVVFTTDHGELLGDHGIWMKGPFHYEQLIKVPFIMQLPGKMYGGKAVDSPVSLADIVPTVLSLCGVDIPDTMDGMDLMPVIKGERERVHDHVLVECTDDPAGLRLKTIVGERYKLTYYHGEHFGELYNLKEDPWERKNLWDDSSMQDIKIRMLMNLLGEIERLEKRTFRYAYA